MASSHSDLSASTASYVDVKTTEVPGTGALDLALFDDETPLHPAPPLTLPLSSSMPSLGDDNLAAAPREPSIFDSAHAVLVPQPLLALGSSSASLSLPAHPAAAAAASTANLADSLGVIVPSNVPDVNAPDHRTLMKSLVLGDTQENDRDLWNRFNPAGVQRKKGEEKAMQQDVGSDAEVIPHDLATPSCSNLPDTLPQQALAAASTLVTQAKDTAAQVITLLLPASQGVGEEKIGLLDALTSGVVAVAASVGLVSSPEELSKKEDERHADILGERAIKNATHVHDAKSDFVHVAAQPHEAAELKKNNDLETAQKELSGKIKDILEEITFWNKQVVKCCCYSTGSLKASQTGKMAVAKVPAGIAELTYKPDATEAATLEKFKTSAHASVERGKWGWGLFSKPSSRSAATHQFYKILSEINSNDVAQLKRARALLIAWESAHMTPFSKEPAQKKIASR